MRDQFGREITYLRLSVIDKCNLRCVYCMPMGGVRGVESSELLTLDEMERLIRLFANLGIRKIRLTGGEPTIRKSLPELLRRIRTVSGIREVAMTTNGVLLPLLAKELKAAGLDRVNISLDTLEREKFIRITGMDHLPEVLRGVEAAVREELTPVKLNTVVMRGINDEEAVNLVHFAIERKVHIRFIEVMPTHARVLQTRDRLVPSKEIKEKLDREFYLEAIPSYAGSPSRDFQVAGTSTTVGFISPLSNFFCASCNRIRLKATGALKTCLHGAEVLNLRDLLRSGLRDEAMSRLIERVVFGRAAEHFLNNEFVPHQDFFMSQVGG